jgi:predicted RNA-binding protein with TRAM domain
MAVKTKIVTAALLRKKLLEMGMDEGDVNQLETREELQEAYDELLSMESGSGESGSGKEEAEKESEEGSSGDGGEEDWVPRVGDTVQFTDDEGTSVQGVITAVKSNKEGEITQVTVEGEDSYEWTLAPDEITLVEEQEGEPSEEEDQASEESSEETSGSDEGGESEGSAVLEVGMVVLAPDPDTGDLVEVTITEIDEETELVQVEDEKYGWGVNASDIRLLEEKEEEPVAHIKKKVRKEIPQGQESKSSDSEGKRVVTRDPARKLKIIELLKKGKSPSQVACIMLGVHEDKPALAREKDATAYNSIYHQVYAYRVEALKAAETKKRLNQKKAVSKSPPKKPLPVKEKAKAPVAKAGNKKKVVIKKKTKVRR